jgi:type IV pilus assembly protein PilN
MKTAVPISINLASDPFRRERADNLAFMAICGILLCSLGVLLGLIFHARSQASDLRRQIDREETRLADLRRQQNQYSAVLTKPENAGTFAYSVFMNQIIVRRAVSWTRVFQDLGTVMPADIRLLGIRLPQVNSEDENSASRIELEMIVGTTKPEAVIGLFKNLQKSALFGAASLVSQTPPTNNDPLYKYRVTVPYDQKL